MIGVFDGFNVGALLALVHKLDQSLRGLSDSTVFSLTLLAVSYVIMNASLGATYGITAISWYFF